MAVKERDILTLSDGSKVVDSSLGRAAATLAVDYLITLAALASTFAAMYRKNPDGIGAAIGVAVLVWILFAVVYGLLCFRGRTIGSLVAGTRNVLVPSGKAPGSWRMAWYCLKVYIFGIIFLVMVLLSDGSGLPTGGAADRVKEKLTMIDLEATRQLARPKA
ncbi:hypothetical protein [Arthrobacter sp. NPDC090010]|uniref:hypothetical protein n=1 Tax=Arthrobacter sp. NPDC090010 TaxID=3363942 RepID=UPI00381D90F9